MATGTITLTKQYGLSNNQTALFDFGAYSIPSGGTYSQHKITCDKSYTPDWPVSWGNEYNFNQYYWGKWYADENKLKHGSYPGHAVIWVKNQSGGFNNITVTVSIEYTYNPYTAVTAGNKIVVADINQTGTSITAGTLINASIKSGLTAGAKITAADFNRIVLGL